MTWRRTSLHRHDLPEMGKDWLGIETERKRGESTTMNGHGVVMPGYEEMGSRKEAMSNPENRRGWVSTQNEARWRRKVTNGIRNGGMDTLRHGAARREGI